ncbi:DEAD/DEAH box helicase [Stigmatella aurantiaca]|uniref:DEAD-box ATP-dependent RNA helicase RhpA n=1 Tax=Stigmatella aurantiaca (strain DW4/3-1) TaxID=378806 RepID=Q090J1_STIAD|nr:DEAD/DEAH box helicase [Stigmatella aurantiaca]ADO70781.1 ATP-dependent RNA helicase RhlE [Stigmatella aurantiaca DW4/3-1]EAU66118.1 ATP-dependent RNA helicase DeaD [Stigmatella aurantiaca DW4/3-1]
MTFDELKLSEPLLRAVKAEGYTTPTPIQQRAIPPALTGQDVLGCAQTGTGKTAAFALPILHRLSAGRSPPPAQGRPIRVLVLTPTRELASQIADSFQAYGRFTGLSWAVIFGGVGQHAQEQTLRRGVDVLIATPGRLLDLMGQGLVSYKALEVFVLDEADRMLDMGFIHDVKRIISALPPKRQTLFFSATMPPEIQSLAQGILKSPVRVEVTPESTTAETVEQKMFFVEREQKRHLLVHLLGDASIRRALVFTRTKHGANRVAKHLASSRISAEAIHGNKSQNARERALGAFKDGSCRVLVATDIAARGIDIEGITHVINFDLPNIPESYVHRIGRTGRAGAVGTALSFCDGEERAYLRDIERTIRRQVPVMADHPFRSGQSAPVPSEPGEARPRPSNEGRRHNSGGQRSQGESQGEGRHRRRRGGRPGGQGASARSSEGHRGSGGRSSEGSSRGPGGRSSEGHRGSGGRAAAAPATAPAASRPTPPPVRTAPKWL